jgi:putative heme-binding domain-containing protein
MRFLLLLPAPCALLHLLAPAMLMAQHGQISVAGRNPLLRDAAAIAAGSKLYATSCAGCHGPDGSGGRGPNLIHRLESNPLKDPELFSTIRNGVPGADMPATPLSDEDTWKLSAFIRALTGPAIDTDVPGDPAAGERVFWSSNTGCSNCHAILGRGNRMGPDLSDVGGTRPLAAIREALIPPKNDPSRNVGLAGREGVTITLTSGAVIHGIARNRSNYSLQVVDESGKLWLLRMDQVKDLKVLDRSLMPDYSTRLDATEMRDLLAYLAHQSLRPRGESESGQEIAQ